jgi:HSP20 family protein
MKLIKSNSNLFPSVFSDLFEMNKFFDNFPWDKDAWLPAANVKEEEKKYEIELAVPGMEKENITVEMEDKLLTISGKDKEEKEEKKPTYLREEYKSSSFIRSFSLLDNADESNIITSYEEGILKIRIGKKPVDVKKEKRAIPIS